MIKNNRLKKNWSEDDIALLVWFVGKYMQQRDIQSHEFLVLMFLGRIEKTGILLQPLFLELLPKAVFSNSLV